MATRKNFDTWLLKYSRQIEDIRQYAKQIHVTDRDEGCT